MLADFCLTADAIAATTKKLEKERLLADYLVSLDDASLERAVVFFAGGPFARRDQRAVGVGGALLSDAVVEVTGQPADEVWSRWHEYGDAGDTLATVFPTIRAARSRFRSSARRSSGSLSHRARSRRRTSWPSCCAS